MKHTLAVTAVGGLALVFLGAGLGAGVAAQNRTGQSGRPMGPMNRLATALDTDRDGTISSTEIATASAALKTIDANGDGQLTIDELRPARGAGGRRGGRGQSPDSQAGNDGPQAQGPRGGAFAGPVLRALDADRNGALSEAELSRATETLKALDANADGQVSIDELRPGRGRGFRGGRAGTQQDQQ